MFLSFFIYLSLEAFCEEATLKIVPLPVFSKVKPGVFLFHEKVKIFVPKGDIQAHYVSDAFNELFKTSVGYVFDVKEYEGKEPSLENSQILLSYDKSIDQEEGYSLLIEPSRIVIKGKTAHGMYHAFTSIRQMLPAFIEDKNGNSLTFHHVVPLQCAEIHDYPRFPYRGLMLDVSRHFSTVDQVKRFIDLIAYHKLSVFHFHLTDDQGWRIEIKKYPKLTEIGAWRDGDRDSTLHANSENDQEQGYVRAGSRNEPYGGFYTQEQISEIVKYAEKRFIRVQPEIETPGHAVAAIASYPWLSCSGNEVKVITSWGIFTPVFCTKDEVMTFIEDVLTEVMDLFPGNVIHVGGDECPSGEWGRCENCKKQMEKNKLTSVGHLHGYFMRRMADHAKKRGRRLIGWDEIAYAGYMDPTTQVMIWQSTSTALEMVKQKHDVVIAPMSHCYFDYGEANDNALRNGNGDDGTNNEEADIQPYTSLYPEDEDDSLEQASSLSSSAESSSPFAPLTRLPKRMRSRFPSSAHNSHNRLPNNGLEHVYSFDPYQLTFPNKGARTNNPIDEANAEYLSHLNDEDREALGKRVLGGQANLWTEHLPQQENRDFNTFPRLAALCEALWTPREKKEYKSFLDRLSFYLVERYKVMGVNYNPMNVLKKDSSEV
ncbi:putative beta-N-acetylglucosaminidase [Monocercomonoides exilis]|uniref:putative beta-N-acetylglucosaminidase n=1 Tax=Monocercomonoides exilis TaxID=2049356 RepID=UPI00355AB1D5|nr:putative beta-N-acetylglucosaminidase [Monocercomonoides exilis]|eukprot:MONOS_5768.1-p1 / transcript=MONOS_5768.1 / gene=MONOS_5768 / organism=Monocercomonoides_exilis_PA203 / gene_product=beta-N-acetylglucosaminidase / transcript_product=beta-N-acetylglucosaminidase / location=Mono_scaffold00172:85685-87649(+) / protein_length=654 / sequence_SO=supercontig / SO=protein_coding / is_pseudo=false